MENVIFKEIINMALNKLYNTVNLNDYFLKGKLQCKYCNSIMKKVTIFYIENKRICKKERYICKTYIKSNGALCKNKGMYANKIFSKIENNCNEEYEKIKFYLDYIEHENNKEKYINLKRNLNVLYLKEEDRYKYYKTVLNNLLDEYKLGLLTLENYIIIKKEFDSKVKKQKIYLEKLVFVKDNINKDNNNMLNLKNNVFKSNFRNMKNIEKIYIENKEVTILKSSEREQQIKLLEALKEVFDSYEYLYNFENKEII